MDYNHLVQSQHNIGQGATESIRYLGCPDRVVDHFTSRLYNTIDKGLCESDRRIVPIATGYPVSYRTQQPKSSLVS